MDSPPPMPVTPRRPRLKRGEQKVLRTQELLDAAWELFAEKGYDAITIDQVAEAAGYSRKPVYTLFGDKQSLFLALWVRLFGELVDLTVSLFEPGAPLRANLKRVADIAAERGREGAARKGEGLFFVVQTIALSREDVATRITDMFEDAITRLAKAIKASRLVGAEQLRGKPETIAAHLMAHINGLSLLQFQTGRNYMRAQDLLDLFVYMSIVDKA
jgi:AcrR family transcriptional regulator